MTIKNFSSNMTQIICFLVCNFLIFNDIGLSEKKNPSENMSTLDIERNSFKKCREENIKLLKNKNLSPKFFKMKLETCREKYPAAGLYISCKKNALKTLKSNPPLLKREIRDCKKLLKAISFSARNPLPFVIVGENLYFAGLGLNKPLSAKEIDHKNFDCGRAKEFLFNPQLAEYFMFGNHPNVFKIFQGLKPKEMKKKLKITQEISKSGIYIDKVGKLFGKLRSPNATLYFPSAGCNYTGNFGSHYIGLSLYYLLNSKKKMLIPYFAIAFYHPNFSGLSKKSLMQRLLFMLQGGDSGKSSETNDGSEKKQDQVNNSKNYKIYPIKSGVELLATEEITNFDNEGDPRNLCQMPRKHNLIGLVKSRDGDSNKIEFILVAKIKNLCKFGENILD